MSSLPPAEPTRCEWCGADFDPSARPPDAVARPTSAPVADGEPLTHCEWCGAEYPTPQDATA